MKSNLFSETAKEFWAVLCFSNHNHALLCWCTNSDIGDYENAACVRAVGFKEYRFSRETDILKGQDLTMWNTFENHKDVIKQNPPLYICAPTSVCFYTLKKINVCKSWHPYQTLFGLCFNSPILHFKTNWL